MSRSGVVAEPVSPVADAARPGRSRWPPPGLRGLRARWRGLPRTARLLVAATALWAAFSAAGPVLSGRWWVWLLPDLAPPPLLPVVPLVLLACCFARPARRVRRALVPVLALLMVAAVPRAGLNWAALAPGGGPGPAPAGALTVYSWNTLYWDTTDDPDAFHRHLAARNADVYLLQEYLAWEDGRPAPIARLDRLRREFPAHHVAVLGELVTLSRYPIVARPPVGQARGLTAGTPWRERFERGKVLRTDIDVGGTVVSFYNVHIPVQLDVLRSPLNPGFYRVIRDSDRARRDHYAALRRDAAANPRPVLISGDFNTTPAMGDLDGLRASFRDALPASGSFLPGTWKAGGAAGLWRLDWTFTDEQLAVHRYAFTSPEGLSDHRGQELTVSLARPSGPARD